MYDENYDNDDVQSKMVTIVDVNDDDGDDGGSPLFFPEHANKFSRSQLGKKDDADDCCDDDDDSDDDDDDDDIQIGPGLILNWNWQLLGGKWN